MDLLNDDTLISIFKYLDLKTRLIASQTCQQWRGLITDSRTRMGNVILEFNFDTDDGNDATATNKVQYLSTLFLHIGQCDELSLIGTNDQITTRVMTALTASHFRVKEIIFQFDAQPINACLQALPASLTDLQIYQPFFGPPPNKLTVWPQHLRLEYLILLDVNLHSSLILPATLKHLNFAWNRKKSHIWAMNWLLDHLPNCSLLEELIIGIQDGTLIIDEIALRKFFRIVSERLPNLRKLRFFGIKFSISNVHNLVEEFESITFPKFDLIEFSRCLNQWNEAAYIIGSIFKVKSIKIVTQFENLIKVYQLTTLFYQKSIELDLNLMQQTPADERINFDGILIPTEFGNLLTNLSLMSHSRQITKSIIGGGQYNKLTNIIIALRGRTVSEIISNVAQACFHLEFMAITNEPDYHTVINLSDFEPFIQYWHLRKSTKLVIEIQTDDLRFSIDALFNIDAKKKDRGTLDETKRWMIIRNLYLSGTPRLGARLIIWNHDAVGNDNGKILMIRDYGT